MSLAGVDAVVTKLVSTRQRRDEMTTEEGVLSTIQTPDEDEEVSCWGPSQTLSHQIIEPSRRSTPVGVPVVSVVDHCNQESVCTALLLQELLKRFFPLTGAGHVLGPDENLPMSVATLLVVCSQGCLQKPSFVRQLFQAEARGIGSIPIIVEDGFQFPSDRFFEELSVMSQHVLSDTLRDPAELVALIKNLFEEIGIHVRPQDSQGALEVCHPNSLFSQTSLTKQKNCWHKTRSQSQLMSERQVTRVFLVLRVAT